MSDLNDRIAIAKGWTWQDDKWFPWHNATGGLATLPDYVGTLEGVAGMLRELNERAKANDQYWWWGVNVRRLVDAPRNAFICVRHGIAEHTLFLVPWFWSPDDRPGDCVGAAYMFVFGKEA